MEKLTDTLVRMTEGFLTWRKRRKYIQKEKSKKKNILLDWIEAFIWSAGMVLLINQFLLQAFVIPSSSMEETLLVNDRIFVNKLVYGPELLPNVGKLPGFAEPKRGDIIIYESPEYQSSGPVYDLVKRMIFMLTLSFVDIDTEYKPFVPNFEVVSNFGHYPKVQFLIKRAAGFCGDQVRFWNNRTYIKPAGSAEWIDEKELTEGMDIPFFTQYRNSENDLIKERGDDFFYKAKVLNRSSRRFEYPGPWERTQAPMEEIDSRLLQTAGTTEEYYKYASKAIDYPLNKDHLRFTTWIHQGTYVPEEYFLPLGDNRDNSRDGRYFGPVRISKILGTPAIRFWPLNRFGGME
jgi:signal peptidase I